MVELRFDQRPTPLLVRVASPSMVVTRSEKDCEVANQGDRFHFVGGHYSICVAGDIGCPADLPDEF